MMIYENTPIITTQKLILRKYTDKDTSDFLEFMSDEEVNTFLSRFTLKTINESKDFLTKNFLGHYNKTIGYVKLSDDESYDFGYGLHRKFWFKGIITEAAKAVVTRIKDACYKYITAPHDVNNPRSGNVLKKLGMTCCYSYVEQWQPKDISVTFRMYQLNFDGDDKKYIWDTGTGMTTTL